MVEVVDPIVLSMKLVEPCDFFPPCPPPCPPHPPPPCNNGEFFPGQGDQGFVSPFESDCHDIPPSICSCFGSDLCFGQDKKRLYVTLGQFSIIRLERDSQLLIPVYDYCLPTKECTGISSDEDPCEVFRQVQFPVDEFFPPSTTADTTKSNCCRC